ncbi:MAG: imidazoleglycerol-phosphate dehydratase HisB [Proteobacteria bacterium]|nr:imidazoleglycerol-phosphate dehydratase HisB [Pseudomonadota bacterium]MCH9757961.1 imidazoleglycerol-phosphate dehydratase HisB [Pseudomonadota bacterium]
MTTSLPPRRADLSRQTNETNIRAQFSIDGAGNGDIQTGIAFFDHMLMQTTRHGGFDLTLQATGDLKIDAHHTVEDCGIVLGQLLAQALSDKSGVCRFGYAYAPLDESLARVVVDLSGRASLSYHAALSRTDVGGMDTDLFREFFQAFVNHAQITLHIDLIRGVNAHHQVEAIFKSFGLALANACTRRNMDHIPSTKGCL